MSRQQRKRLFDMLDAARAIGTYAAGRTPDDFFSDRAFRDAVYFNFLIIGEALAALLREEKPFAASISEARRIVAFRNQIAHGYGDLNHAVTWQIVTEKLPVLVRELESLLGDVGTLG